MKGSQTKLSADEAQLRNQVLIDYLPLVIFEARRVAARLPPSVDSEDLVSAGILGLIDAVEKFEPAREVKFKTYASFRIRGAMLDFLRANDNYPRSVREFSRELEQACEEFLREKGRSPSLLELAQLLGRSEDDVSKKMAHLPAGPSLEIVNDSGQEMLPLEEFRPPSGGEMFEQNERRAFLMEVIGRVLNEREKTVLQLYYWDELNLKEIARILDVTESRVSQILNQARRRISVKLRNIDSFDGVA